jgi:hypothetical protein
MGCEVGAKKQTFTQELAESIAKIGFPVCVSAPKQEIQPYHLEDLLRQLRLGDVRQKCADRVECILDGNVTVVSAVASP